VNETTLYIGEWVRGQLIQRTDKPAIYDVKIETDLAHNWYAEGGNMPSVTADFSTPTVLLLKVGGTGIPFVKDFSLEDLPVEPWPEDSCGYTKP
jgi:hypothetical protein